MTLSPGDDDKQSILINFQWKPVADRNKWAHMKAQAALVTMVPLSLVGDRKSLSALFLPKLSAEILAESLSVLRRSFGVLAETANFGRNSHFWQK